MNIGSAIITYNPNIELLLSNIKAVRNNGIEKIFIYDNGSENYKQICKICEEYGIAIANALKNQGIAYALNQCLKYAGAKQWEWLLTLDQDSICPNGFLDNIQTLGQSLEVGIWFPLVTDRNINNVNAIKKSKLQCVIKSGLDCFFPTFKDEMPITSGSLVNIRIALECGGFSDDLFIDCVDFDFDLKIYEHGYKIMMFPSLPLNHQLGNQKSIRFLGSRFVSSGHPAWRYYYRMRNGWLIRRSHKTSIAKKWANSYLARCASPINIVCIFIANSFDVSFIKCCIYGIFDGMLDIRRCHEEILKIGQAKKTEQ